MVAHPRLPQIRTCGFPASGSSGAWVRYATSNRSVAYPLVQKAPDRTPGDPLASLLSVAVLLRRLPGSMSRSSVPPTVPCPGAPFPPQGPLGRFPRFSGTMRHSDCLPSISPRFVAFAWRYRPAPTRPLPSSGGAPRIGLGFDHRSPDRTRETETTSPPGFPGNPSCACHGRGPRRDLHADDRYGAQVLPSTKVTASALVLTILFGALYNGLPTPCERFAARVATGLTHHSVPAGDRPWPGRIRCLQGSKQGFEVIVELHHLFLLVRALPGARLFGQHGSVVSGAGRGILP